MRRAQIISQQLLSSPEQLSQPKLPSQPKPLLVETKPLDPNLGFGVEVLNVDLRYCGRAQVVDELIPLARQHKLLIVRGAPGGIDGVRHAEITRWMSPCGKLYNMHQMHERQHTPEVFRLSNDAGEGVPGVGGAWHHDSLHLGTLPPFQVLHMRSSPAWAQDADGAAQGLAGATWFARADASRLSPFVRQRLSRLYGFYLPTGEQHPLLDDETCTMLPPSHAGVVEIDPDTGKRAKLTRDALRQLTLDYHRLLLKGEAFDFATPPALSSPAHADQPEEAHRLDCIVRQLEDEAFTASAASVYRHVWREGDVVIADNVALAHRAPTNDEIGRLTGTRTLHRCIAMPTQDVPSRD